MARPLPLSVLASLALSAVLSGCYSKATAREGRLTFAYASTVEIENFVKPIAPGARLEVRAFANGTEEDLVITAARSSRPEVVAIREVRPHGVVLEGRAPGSAEIELTARDEVGGTLVDTMFFHVAAPTTHALEHACTEERDAVYVRGGDIFVHHGLATSDGRPVIGTGNAPFRVDPPESLELVAAPQAGGFYRLRAPRAEPRISLRSTVDDDELTLKIVDRGDLTEASLDHDAQLLEGEMGYVVARVSAGEATLCDQTALTRARSLTPDVCDVTARLDELDGPDDENREQLALVTARAFGVCKLEITLPELAGGRGVVLTGELQIGRVQYPADERAGPFAAARASLRAAAQPLLLATVARDAAVLALGLFWAAARARRRARRGRS
jgi:hypothetical protein